MTSRKILLHILMRRNSRIAVKRRIPQNPGESRCQLAFDVDNEAVIMIVDCRKNCDNRRISQDICWSNLVRAISKSALPDKIILKGEKTVICDKVFVSLLRNAASLVRRIEFGIEALKKTQPIEHSDDGKSLTDLLRAILYDVPQLIERRLYLDDNATPPEKSKEDVISQREYSVARELLRCKKRIGLSDESSIIA